MGAVSLLAPGSAIADNYREFEQRLEAAFQIVWQERQPITSFGNQAVTLMDLRMPQMGGVEAITAICAEFKPTRIMVLITYDGDEDIYRELQAGAKGYLLAHRMRLPRLLSFWLQTTAALSTALSCM